MQWMVTLGDGAVVQIKCPVCESVLESIREQDWRVHIMHHPLAAECLWSDKMFRIDRLGGYGEPWPEVQEEEEAPCSTEGETRTSTTTSAPSLPTTITKPTRPTHRATPAGALGRIRR